MTALACVVLFLEPENYVSFILYKSCLNPGIVADDSYPNI